MLYSADRQDIAAISRARQRPAFITPRHHHQHARSGHFVNHALVAGRAGTAAAKTQVDDAGRIGVGRQADDRETRRPAHAVQNVAEQRAALTGYAQGQDAAIPVQPRHAQRVVGGRGNLARNKSAVPRAVFYRAAGEQGAVALNVAAADPVAWVAGVGVPAIAIVGIFHFADHVVAGQQAARQVGVAIARTGVHHGHHHGRVAGGGVPGGGGVQGAGKQA